jgi:hypothetical protein
MEYFFQSPAAAKAICKTISYAIVYTKKGINYTKKLLRLKMFDEVREELKDLAGLYYTIRREPVEERLEGYQSYCCELNTHIKPPRNLRELRTFENRLEKRLRI